jgi:N-succinyldiaminopimelate aminotransferase
VRLRELLADIKPGKPAINLSVGEPQHPIPPFVGPVLAAHLNDFGRYPDANKGTDGFPQGRRRLARPAFQAQPAGRSRERSARAQRHARGPVPRRDRRQALGRQARRQAGDPDSQSVLRAYSAGASPPTASRSICRPRAKPASCPISTRSPRAARAHRRVLSRLAVEPAGRGRRRAYLRGSRAGAALRLPDVRRRMLLRDLWQRPPPHGMLEVAGPDFANVVVFHSLSKRSNLPGLRVGFAPATALPGRFLELRNVAAPQVPVPAQEVAIAAYGDEAHVEENRELYKEKFDLADQIIGNRYGYSVRPAASSSGSTCRSRAATRRDA